MADFGDTLERQLLKGFRRLRFDPELERAFREHQVHEALSQRLLLLIIGAVLVAVMPFLDAWVLHPPEEFMVESRRIQFCVILPSMLLAAAFAADPRLRRWADPVGLLALFVVVCGWVYQRHIGAEYGYEVPAILVGVVVAGLFALAGLLFWTVAPVAVIGLILFAAVEIGTNGIADTNWYSILGLFMLALVTGVAGYSHEYSQRANWLRSSLLNYLTLHDPLTRLLNYRAFQQLYRQILSVAHRERRPVLVVALDVDHFKAFNDRYGHPKGDECLRQVTALLKKRSQRTVDLVARTGGEEFALVWYDIAETASRNRLEQLRQAVADLAIPNEGHPGQVGAVVTVSVGAVWLAPQAPADADSVFRAADAALYEAKRKGRNRVVFTTASQLPQERSQPEPRRQRASR